MKLLFLRGVENNINKRLMIILKAYVNSYFSLKVNIYLILWKLFFSDSFRSAFVLKSYLETGNTDPNTE